jgi:hypothetical protein
MKIRLEFTSQIERKRIEYQTVNTTWSSEDGRRSGSPAQKVEIYKTLVATVAEKVFECEQNLRSESIRKFEEYNNHTILRMVPDSGVLRVVEMDIHMNNLYNKYSKSGNFRIMTTCKVFEGCKQVPSSEFKSSILFTDIEFHVDKPFPEWSSVIEGYTDEEADVAAEQIRHTANSLEVEKGAGLTDVERVGLVVKAAIGA